MVAVGAARSGAHGRRRRGARGGAGAVGPPVPEGHTLRAPTTKCFFTRLCKMKSCSAFTSVTMTHLN